MAIYTRMDAQRLLDDGLLKIIGGCLACFNGFAWSFDQNDIKRTVSQQYPGHSDYALSETITFAKLLANDPKDKKKYIMKDNPFLIPFRNGVLNINSMEFLASSKALPCCCYIDCNWNPETDTTNLIAFFHGISGHNPETEMKLLELVGSVLFRRRIFQVLWILYGKGANGKSVFLNLLHYMLGSSNISNVSIRQLSGRFGASCIRNHLLNANADIESEKIDASGQSILKNVASGDAFATESKGHDLESSFAVFPMLVFSCNSLPIMDDRTDGFTRRLRIIPFTESFTKDNPLYNPGLSEELCNEENASALAFKAIQALKYCLETGTICETNEMKRAKADYLLSCKPLLSFYGDLPNIIGNAWTEWRKSFIKETEKAPTNAKDIIVSLSTRDLYSIYKTWCDEEGCIAIKKVKFTNELKDHFNLESRQTTDKYGNRIRVLN